MTSASYPPPPDDPAARDADHAALDGEPGIPDVAQPRPARVDWKGIFAVAMLALSLVVVTSVSINRALSGSKRDDEAKARKAGESPTAAMAEPRRLDMGLPPPARASAPSPTSAPVVPAIVPTPEDALPDPIGIRRQPASQRGGQQPVPPEDAPVMLVAGKPSSAVNPAVSRGGRPRAEPADNAQPPADPLEATQRNLEAYQRQLQGLLDSMNRTASSEADSPGAPSAANAPSPRAQLPAMPFPAGAGSGAGLFGGQLQGSATPRVAATVLGNRSLTLPKGTAFTCALKTRVVSAASGLVGCQVQRNVYGEDGRVLLVERGSHLDGEYRVGSLKPGTVRIPVLWTRIRTPNGVTVDIDSPGIGALGESGIEGHVDNRWGSRIGAAMLLSLIDDSVKLIVQNHASDREADTIVLPSTTGSTSKLAEKVLESTINIPPLIHQNQGGIVGVYVARDVDFAGVYELKAVGP